MLLPLLQLHVCLDVVFKRQLKVPAIVNCSDWLVRELRSGYSQAAYLVCLVLETQASRKRI